MINGLEGIPGSGKSYEAVVFHVLPMLQSGRKVITNLPLLVDVLAAIDSSYRPLIELRTRPRPVRGTWDATRVDEQGNGNAFELFSPEEDGTPHIEPAPDVHVFGHVWDFYTTWKHPTTGQGPVFIIDECHVCFPKIGCDQQVVEWFKLHRHFTVDVLLMTQTFRDINASISVNIGMLIKVRKADFLGKSDSYVRKVHAGYRGPLISTDERKYKPEFFSLYRSHTQGNSVAESAALDVMPFLVKFKRFTWLFWAASLAIVVFLFWPGRKHKPEPHKTASVSVSTVAAAVPSGHVQHAPATAVAPAAAASAPEVYGPGEIPDPYASKGLHLTGRMTMGKRILYTFAVSNGGVRIGQVTSDDLVQVGYKWEPLTDCAGTLRWKTTAKPITCDAPTVAEGSQSAPVVIGYPSGNADHAVSTQKPSS